MSDAAGNTIMQVSPFDEMPSSRHITQRPPLGQNPLVVPEGTSMYPLPDEDGHAHWGAPSSARRVIDTIIHKYSPSTFSRNHIPFWSHTRSKMKALQYGGKLSDVA